MSSTDAFWEYRKVRNELTKTCTKLHHHHREHTKCRKGCDECCINFSVLAVEFFSILDSIKDHPPKMNLSDDSKCLFLVDHACQIYDHRPYICRSHGLPILNMDEAGEQWELSYCPLNFTDVDVDYFTLDNGFQQDLHNSKLYLANREYLQADNTINYSDNELIELRKIKDYLDDLD